MTIFVQNSRRVDSNTTFLSFLKTFKDTIYDDYWYVQFYGNLAHSKFNKNFLTTFNDWSLMLFRRKYFSSIEKSPHNLFLLLKIKVRVVKFIGNFQGIRKIWFSSPSTLVIEYYPPFKIKTQNLFFLFWTEVKNFSSKWKKKNNK